MSDFIFLTAFGVFDIVFGIIMIAKKYNTDKDKKFGIFALIIGIIIVIFELTTNMLPNIAHK